MKKDLTNITKEELYDSFLRVSADLENIKRRKEKEIKEEKEKSEVQIILKTLKVIDNLRLALKFKNSSDQVMEGLEITLKGFKDEFSLLGLEEIQTNKGIKFNPELHEAISIKESLEETGIILDTFKIGYKLFDKVIRHSQVIVSKNINN